MPLIPFIASTSAAGYGFNKNSNLFGYPYEGGFFAGQISTAGNGVADYNLVVSPASSGQTQKVYKTSNTDTPGTLSDIDGPGNTAACITAGAADHPAADFCDGLTIGGFSDWYLPAKNELEIIYYHLKPSADANSTDSGINPNAVPARASNYTATDPSRTTASDFLTGNSQAMAIFVNVLSSTQLGSSVSEVGLVKTQRFNNGSQSFSFKSVSQAGNCRAVRRVAI